jgi:hypothetical protein
MNEYVEPEIETDVLCFQCGIRYGLDCAGREENESTLCSPCLADKMAKLMLDDLDHWIAMLDRGELSLQDFFKLTNKWKS